MSNIKRSGILYEADAGANVGVAIKEALEEQQKSESGESVYLWFNEILLEIRADATFESVNRDYVYKITERRMKIDALSRL